LLSHKRSSMTCSPSLPPSPLCPPPSVPSIHLACLPHAQVSGERDFFAEMVVDAVTALDLATLDLKMIGMKKVRAREGTVQGLSHQGWVCAFQGTANGVGQELRKGEATSGLRR